jgi:hypothetical protein
MLGVELMGGVAAPLPSAMTNLASRLAQPRRNGSVCHHVPDNSMPKIVDDLFAEWPMIKAAPRSIAVIAVVIIVAAWLAINWSYSAVISGKDGQIGILRDRIGAYEQKLQGATPDQAAGELKALRDQVEEQKKQLDRLMHPPHDPLGLYQDGISVAMMRAAIANPMDDTIILQMVGSRSPLDMNRTFEFREFRVLCSGQSTGNMSMGPQTTILYQTIICKIQK